jgi:hypothetical protein
MYVKWFLHRIEEYFNHGVVFKISLNLFQTSKDILFLAVYIPPEGSPVYNNEENKGIDIIESKFNIYNNNLVDLLIDGDLYVWTARHREIISVNKIFLSLDNMMKYLKTLTNL